MNYQSTFQTSTPSAPKQTVGNSTFSNLHAVNEARWWNKNFNLGGKLSRKHVSGSSLILEAPNKNVISGITFDVSSAQKNTFAVTSGPRVLLYGKSASAAISRKLDREVQGLKSITSPQVQADRKISTGGPAYCASFRSDGKLLLIGASDACVKVFDTSTRATLKSFNHEDHKTVRGHVRAVAWINTRQMVSGGDDGIVRIWDFSSDKPIFSLHGHGDAVRSVVVVQKRKGEHKLVTGSYDHSIRIWDLEKDTENEDRCLAVLDHGCPVEDLVTIPGPAGLVASAGGTMLKVWDISSGQLIHKSVEHSKTITSLCIIGDAGVNSKFLREKSDSSNSNLRQYRLISGGLDGHIKIYDTGTMKCLHGICVAQHRGVSVTSIAASQDGMRLIIGFSDGTLSLRQKRIIDVKIRKDVTQRAGTFGHAIRGATENIRSTQDYAVDISSKKRKLHSFDKSLKKFHYSEALDQALATKQPEAVSVVIEELAKRRGLERALSNRDEQELEPIVSFTLRYITQPKYASTLIHVCHKLCDIYGSVLQLGQSSLMDDLFEKIRSEVKREVKVERDVLQLLGQIETIINVSTIHDKNTAT